MKTLPIPTRRRLLQALSLSPLAGTGLLVSMAACGHEGHAASAEGVKLSLAKVSLSGLTLTRQDGAPWPLVRLLEEDRPVFLNFIFTSCTAICPVLSQVFAETRDRLGAQKGRVHFVSISIDPEQDTPRRLRDYAARFGADADWSFFTGSLQDSLAAQQAFGVNRGDKMNHSPVTFVHSPREAQWTRIDGFAGPSVLLEQYRTLNRRG